MVRVGVVFGFDENWLGGINYFRNLFNAVYENPNRRIEIVVFTGSQVDNSRLKGFPPIEVVRSHMLDSASFAWRIRRLFKRVLVRDWLLEGLLRKHHISVLSHSGWLGKKSSIRTLGWIPDFQILRLPEFFSPSEISALAKDFEYIARYCSKVMVSSEDALKDLYQFYPESRGRAEVLSFAVRPIPHSHALTTTDELQARYGFKGNYFLLPNQFWAHKNHRIILDALAILKAQGKEVLVLATGNTKDYRQPDYFDGLMKHAEHLGVADNFRVLGIVPLDDLYALMKHALALINPSLFEGWSTTVEEGKAMGKTIVLSDIPVHQEQNPSHALFFGVNDAGLLAGHLVSMWEQGHQLGNESEIETHNLAAARFHQFGDKYQNLIVSVMQ